jgi:N4-gp56 family major capsid protein
MAGQLWGTDNLGGFMYSDELSDKLRMELKPMVQYRQHCDAKDAMSKGLNAGDKYHWNVYSKVATQGAALTETSTMPETNFTITQGELTVTEYGNSVPFSEKLNSLSKHSVEEVIDNVLKDDAAKAFDIGAHAEFAKTMRTVVATAAGTASAANTVYREDGTATTNNNAALDKYHVKDIVDHLKEWNVPTFNGGDYFAIARPSTFRTLKNDMEELYKYDQQGFRMIMNGEIGRYEGVRFIEQTNIAASATFATNGKSDECFFFGRDTVAEAIVVPEEIRGKIPTDYGRSRGIAWYSLSGFGLVHTDALNCRIVKWASAA